MLKAIYASDSYRDGTLAACRGAQQAQNRCDFRVRPDQPGYIARHIYKYVLFVLSKSDGPGRDQYQAVGRRERVLPG
jgi:hypothetical protein